MIFGAFQSLHVTVVCQTKPIGTGKRLLRHFYLSFPGWNYFRLAAKLGIITHFANLKNHCRTWGPLILKVPAAAAAAAFMMVNPYKSISKWSY